MTQLLGRILRLPHVAKTGRAALDACHVLCHDARTGDVVKAVKKSLESEGMGDLEFTVRGDPGDPGVTKPVMTRRRPEFASLRLFVPRVTWVETDGTRRELDYDSDVLGLLPWQELRSEVLADGWAPDGTSAPAAEHLAIGLDILDGPSPEPLPSSDDEVSRLDRARIVRALIDLAPNAWLVWDWVDATVTRLLARGLAERALARSVGSLIERLRADLELQRDRLAEGSFGRLLQEGRIEFRLRADAHDYALPTEYTFQVSGKPQWLQRESDGQPMQRSLFAPALRLPDMNEFEVRVAGYLDQQSAVRWWHRNVAKAQVGLQGWKRHKVYPDFVFALRADGQVSRLVLLETKGLHLQGEDTAYKAKLLERLSAAFDDERAKRVGSLELEGAGLQSVVCDLVFDQAWQGVLADRYFQQGAGAG